VSDGTQANPHKSRAHSLKNATSFANGPCELPPYLTIRTVLYPYIWQLDWLYPHIWRNKANRGDFMFGTKFLV